MEMIQVKTADLIGAQLDWAVAKAAGFPLCDEAMQPGFVMVGTGEGDLEPFSPSADWADFGPLVDVFQMSFMESSFGYRDGDGKWQPVRIATIGFARTVSGENAEGKDRGMDYKVAGCRAIVLAKLGDEVEVPA
jgi:hypothetical protein